MIEPDQHQGRPGQSLASWRGRRFLFWAFLLAFPVLCALGYHALLWAASAVFPAP